MSRDWLSNSWLVADEPGGHAVIVDTGGPMEPIVQTIAEQRLTLTRVLCTHHHHDHVLHNADYRDQFGCPVCGHGAEVDRFGGLDEQLADGDEVRCGALTIRALHIPGHTAGQLAFVVNDTDVFTGDTLFRGSVGGTRAPGHTTFEELQHSIMETLMALPREMAVHPGHTDSTTIGHEWEENPFVRMWRGVESQGASRCTAFGRPATLLLRAKDYDGGTKCWVQFESDQSFDVVPGSRVQ